MKFRLSGRIFKPPKRKSLLSMNKPRSTFDTMTVETWNEFRLIGSEAVHRKQFGTRNSSVAFAQIMREDEDDEAPKIQEHDWDYYIAQFNEQYKQQLRNTTAKDDDEESISTIADTESQLLRIRKIRLVVYRKLLIFVCLLLWVLCLATQFFWYRFYHYYPTGFVKPLDPGLSTQFFSARYKWVNFGINCHTWAMGEIGLLCTLCFRDKPAILRQIILRSPFILLLPLFVILLAVKFMGSFSRQTLADVMYQAILNYYLDAHPPLQFEASTEWDKIQKTMYCCGVAGPSDWDKGTPFATLDTRRTSLPKTCCARPDVRRNWPGEQPPRDDCYYKANKQYNTNEFEWAFPEGCLLKAYDLYVKEGALIVGMNFASFCLLCLFFGFGKLLYTKQRKVMDYTFKYSWKQYLKEIFFITELKPLSSKIAKRFPQCQRYFFWLPKPIKEEDNRKSKTSSSVSSKSISVKKVPGVIITEPDHKAEHDSPPEKKVVKKLGKRSDASINSIDNDGFIDLLIASETSNTSTGVTFVDD